MKNTVLFVNIVLGLALLCVLFVTAPIWSWTMPVKVDVPGRRVSIWSPLWSKSRSDGSGRGYTPIQWFLRYPLHDFSWYVMGIVGTQFKTRGCIGDASKTLMSDVHKDGWIVCYRITESGLKLPYVAYSHIFTGGVYQFYFGWRHHGAFGIKHRFPKA